MDTRTKLSLGRSARRCKTSSVVFAALVAAGVIGMQPVGAKEAAKGNADPKAATPATAQPLRGPSCTGEVREGGNVFVPVGKSTLVPLEEATIARTIGNPVVAQATLV